MPINFGPAGSPDNFPHKTSVKMPPWLKEQGLQAYEYQ